MTTTDPYAPPAAAIGPEATHVIDNPHTLWKQIIGVAISSIIALLAGGVVPGILLVLTGVFTFVDAWNAGIYKRPDSKSFLNISPMGWAITMQLLLLVTFPVYLISRNKLKTKSGKVTYLVLAILFGTLTFAVTGLAILVGIMQAAGVEG